MQENILLMFLSDIKARDGEILKTHYTNLEGEDTHATNIVDVSTKPVTDDTKTFKPVLVKENLK